VSLSANGVQVWNTKEFIEACAANKEDLMLKLSPQSGFDYQQRLLAVELNLITDRTATKKLKKKKESKAIKKKKLTKDERKIL